MPVGSVKWFDARKGYGFIEPDGAETDDRDMFLHISEVKKIGLADLERGQRISYEIVNPKGKPCAGQLKLI